jgi:glucose 1-dehydrogenase
MGRLTHYYHLDEACGEAEFVFEATGIVKLQIQLIDALGINGIYVATGIRLVKGHLIYRLAV